jgi:hypothetical protein
VPSRTVLLSMLEEDRERRAKSAKEILERLSHVLNKGRGALPQHELPTLEMNRSEILTPPPVADSDPAVTVAAAKRKARLTSLLDEM